MGQVICFKKELEGEEWRKNGDYNGKGNRRPVSAFQHLFLFRRFYCSVFTAVVRVEAVAAVLGNSIYCHNFHLCKFRMTGGYTQYICRLYGSVQFLGLRPGSISCTICWVFYFYFAALWKIWLGAGCFTYLISPLESQIACDFWVEPILFWVPPEGFSTFKTLLISWNTDILYLSQAGFNRYFLAVRNNVWIFLKVLTVK